ncbi:MAG: hypothetical protein WCO56_29440 [Verrucomicrobiota bacterium]
MAPAQSRLGMNLAGPADWSTEYAYADLFHLSRKWISQRKGTAWGKGPELERDANGWVTKLEPDCWAETLMLTGNNGHAPAGDYVCLYEGDGEIDFGPPGKVTTREPGRLVVNVDTHKGDIHLMVRRTNPQNHVRNIRLIIPGCEATYKTDPFNPAFLQRWREFNTFRFMDWMHSNGSKQKEWADRPTPEYCNYTEHGVPVEVMVDLCNRLKINPWFCLPHLASDDYVRQFAKLVKSRLDPALKVHIEYSNEVWNSMFEQHRYAETRARELGLGPKDRPWEGAGMFYSQRSQEIFKILEDIFGGKDRLVRIIAWQAAGGSYWLDKIVLAHNETYKHADALAIAPYVTFCIPAKSNKNGLSADQVAQWTVDQLLAACRT